MTSKRYETKVNVTPPLGPHSDKSSQEPTFKTDYAMASPDIKHFPEFLCKLSDDEKPDLWQERVTVVAVTNGAADAKFWGCFTPYEKLDVVDFNPAKGIIFQCRRMRRSPGLRE